MIINEYELAERVLSTKEIKEKSDLFVVAKYLRNEIDCDVLETISMLNTILEKSDKNYNPIKWAKSLEKMAIKAANYPLKKVDYIDVTKKEYEKIQELNSPKLQRLLFSLLVHAKYNNLLSSDNNNWCNISLNELYRTAKVSTRNAKEKALLVNKLNTLGVISFSRKNTNLNMQCLIIDDNSEIKVKITDIRELGYQYLSLKNGQSFSKCQKCGIIIKKKSKNDYSTKYCKECLNASRNEILLKSFHKLD